MPRKTQWKNSVAGYRVAHKHEGHNHRILKQAREEERSRTAAGKQSSLRSCWNSNRKLGKPMRQPVEGQGPSSQETVNQIEAIPFMQDTRERRKLISRLALEAQLEASNDPPR
eukprot:Gregarina_sp_Poly_1__8499@NODE_500_length_7882_cov_255_800640_g400_i0_p4_GENE_NODE_500_length_7882_cov_255_800640_g400_i0NODE_500_length_7882_cov_255_800640_g400_i0_p4_ORF_typecomplete_len113_score5_83_NODE_500_length_7882_cov_255_800640_g400_i014751813